MSYLERIAEENLELLSKLDKLELFIISDEFDKLGDEDQKLLFLQSHAMASYSAILDIRLKREHDAD